ncbi:hypothetical protein KIN20_002390 [Parelaphostrongylus tenuis]|uniref:Uncharacterized protein n=1 Tax=Parelaphostrongylus tenuis TaxID=148309 RepID=A0AAD5MNI3_PARTN|nr:hypothetical protein KIN20_002390 [Parelaphostrongylus tenuis]
MNVERTIQAFCEDGASEVLGDWVRPAAGSGKSKNKKKKKKKDKQQCESETGSVAPTASPSSGVAKASPQDSKPQVKSPTPQPPVMSSPQSNGYIVHAESVDTKRSDKDIPVAEHIQHTFKALRSAIAEREKMLLAMCGTHSKFVDADFNHLMSLIEKFGSVISTQGTPSTPAAASVPKAVSPVQAAAIKHATSQSSISSSLGADSGVNLSPTHNEDKAPSKPAVPAKVVSGGIQMQSDVLSADQLEALQRSLAAQLAAFGIDASILSGVTAGDMPVRRSRRVDFTKKGSVQYRNEKTSIRPQLSIL